MKMLAFLLILNFCVFNFVDGNQIISDELQGRNQLVLLKNHQERNGRQLEHLEAEHRQLDSSLFSWSNIRLGAVWPPVVPDWYYPRVSEHFMDPYSLTHVLHGYIFYYVPGTPFQEDPVLGFSWALAIETIWEVLENSDLVIDRYRETSGTSREYAGDSVLNSIGDIVAMSVGYWIAAISDANGMNWIPLALTLISEVGLLFYMRDNFLITSMANIFPVDSIASWQEEGIPKEFQPTQEISHSGLNIMGEAMQDHTKYDPASETQFKMKMVIETILAVLFTGYTLPNSDTPWFLESKL